MIIFSPEPRKRVLAFRKRDFRLRDGGDQPFAAVVNARQSPRNVMDDKCGGLKPRREMGHQQIDYVVIGRTRRIKHAVVRLLKAEKSAQ